jgi:hypothetical protein
MPHAIYHYGFIMGVKVAKRISAVVVVAGLAVVILLSLGGVTSKSAVAACNSDAKTVQTAIAAFQTVNPTLPVTPKSLMSTANGGPFLNSWPSNGAHYDISLTPAGVVMVAAPSKATAAPYDTPNPCRSAS